MGKEILWHLLTFTVRMIIFKTAPNKITRLSKLCTAVKVLTHTIKCGIKIRSLHDLSSCIKCKSVFHRMLSDNSIKTIGSEAFTVPKKNLLM